MSIFEARRTRQQSYENHPEWMDAIHCFTQKLIWCVNQLVCFTLHRPVPRLQVDGGDVQFSSVDEVLVPSLFIHMFIRYSYCTRQTQSSAYISSTEPVTIKLEKPSRDVSSTTSV